MREILWDVNFGIKDKEGFVLTAVKVSVPFEQIDRTFDFILSELQRLNTPKEVSHDKPEAETQPKRKRGRPRKAVTQ